jgi:hypothetical protein
LVSGRFSSSHQEQVKASFNGVALQDVGFAPQSTAQVVKLLVDQLDDVEVIEDQRRARQVFQDGAPVVVYFLPFIRLVLHLRLHIPWLEAVESQQLYHSRRKGYLTKF